MQIHTYAQKLGTCMHVQHKYMHMHMHMHILGRAKFPIMQRSGNKTLRYRAEAKNDGQGF
uniref:Uncharacterized protein n=1 Tax=Anguilla anguilla TaxID=7936 RepID=A0A0E9XQS1_ANGAN